MARDYGYEWEDSVYAYLKVAMAKRKDKEEIEEESFDATCRLFDHESDVTVIDNEVTELHQDDKYFTVADVRLDLRIKVTAHDIDKAIEEAEKVADEVAKRLPAGVSYVESNYYDTEKGEKAIDWDVA
jgi:hypothetical protein